MHLIIEKVDDIFGNPYGTIIICNNVTEMRLIVELLVEEGVSLARGSTPSKVYGGNDDAWEHSGYHNIILEQNRIDGCSSSFNIESVKRDGRVVLSFGEAIAFLAKQQAITESEFDAEFDALMA